jgi:hypothetical protein
MLTWLAACAGHPETVLRRQLARGLLPGEMSCIDWLLAMGPFQRPADVERYGDGLREAASSDQVRQACILSTQRSRADHRRGRLPRALVLADAARPGKVPDISPFSLSTWHHIYCGVRSLWYDPPTPASLSRLDANRRSTHQCHSLPSS